MSAFNSFPLAPIQRRQTGFSLIEMMVVVVIVVILLVTGVSWGQNYTANNRVRSATETFRAALGVARAEAIQRNRPVNLVLAGAQSEWLVQTVETVLPNPAPVTTTIRRGSYLDTRDIDGPDNITVVFDAFGRATMLGGAAIPLFNFGSTKGTCQSGGGQIRCLRVELTASGQATMCDRQFLYVTDPRGCRQP
jgi:type IV fimbrial biogenesis protein FimT